MYYCYDCECWFEDTVSRPDLFGGDDGEVCSICESDNFESQTAIIRRAEDKAECQKQN